MQEPKTEVAQVKSSAKVGRALRFGLLEMVLLLLGILFVRREIWQLHAVTFSIAFWQEGLLIPLSALDGAITGAYASRRRQVQNSPAYKGMLRWATPLFFFLYVGCAALSERLMIGVFPTAAHEVVRTIGLAIVLAGMGVRLWAQSSAPIQLTMDDDTPAGEPGRGDAQGLASGEPAQSPFPEPQASEADPTLPLIDVDADAPSIDSASDPELPAEAAITAPEPVAVSTSIFPAGPHKLLRHPDASGKLLSLCGLPLVFNSWLPLLALPGVIILLKWHISDQEAFRISQLGEPYLEYRKKTWNLIPYLY